MSSDVEEFVVYLGFGMAGGLSVSYRMVRRPFTGQFCSVLCSSSVGFHVHVCMLCSNWMLQDLAPDTSAPASLRAALPCATSPHLVTQADPCRHHPLLRPHFKLTVALSGASAPTHLIVVVPPPPRSLPRKETLLYSVCITRYCLP